MYSEQGIDWYSVSKFDNERIDLKAFSEIVGRAQPSQDIDRVTLHYRKKLLILFQNANQIVKQRTPELVMTNSDLQVKKSITSDNLHTLEGQAEQSFKEISNMKLLLAEKKRLMGKLRQKLSKKVEISCQKVYCCTICNRQDFKTVDLFKNHMEKEHDDYPGNRGQNSSQVTDMKDLLMTMKDKEIEMMSMFLKANKEMQTQKLEKDYDVEYRKAMQISGAKTEESKDEGEPVELKGESQFLFFQKSDQFKRQMERDQEFKRKVTMERSQRHTTLKEFYQPNNYYNVFGSIQENTSDHFEEPKSKRRISEEKETKQYGLYDPAEFLSKYLQTHQNVSSDSRFTLLENTPRPLVEGKTLSKESMYAPPSISDRLKQEHKKSKPMDTIYSTKRKFYEDEDKGYVFNSGPLLDDKGEGSDYEDYFGDAKHMDISIQDEQIKANHFNNNISNYNLSKESLFLSKLLSPKNDSVVSNSILDRSGKQKSSVIVDLSDSFSKRDFEISKDDVTINLSDLKLSKLQKKKDEGKYRKYLEKDETLEKEMYVLPQQHNHNHNHNSSQGVRTEGESNRMQRERQSQPSGVRILSEFERPKVVPKKDNTLKLNETGNSLDTYIKSNDRTNVLGSTTQQLTNQNSVGILNDFFKQQFKTQVEPRAPQSKQQLSQFMHK